MFCSGLSGITSRYARRIITRRPHSKTQPPKRSAKQGCTVSRKIVQPIAMTGCMRLTMTEQEQQRLISGLIKQREAWQPARQRAHTKPVTKRMSQRDRELMECFRNR
ncbi:hypothetical protein D3C76_1370880 [compost metagenome]